MTRSTITPDGVDSASVTTLRALMPLLLAHFFLHAAFAGTRMAAPLLILRQGHTTLAVGVMLAMLSITAVVLAIPAGRLTDRFGLRWPFAWAAVSSVLGVALCAGVGAGLEQYWALCAGAVLIGLGLNLGVIALQRHAGRLSTHHADIKRVFSWMSLAPAFSNFAGPLVTGIIIDLAGFVWALVVLMFMPLLGWRLVHRMAEAPLDARHTEPSTPQILPGSSQRALVGQVPVATDERVSAWSVLQRPGMMRLLLVNALLAMAWDVHTFVVPVLGHERGLSATVIGSLLGAFALSATLVRLVIPALSQHLSEWPVIMGSMVVSAIVFVLYPLSPGVMTMALCSSVLGVALGSVQPMVMSLLHLLAPANAQGLALGLRLTVLNLTATIFPLLFGALGGVLGVSVVFWGTAAVQALGTFVARPPKPPARGPSEPA